MSGTVTMPVGPRRSLARTLLLVVTGALVAVPSRGLQLVAQSTPVTEVRHPTPPVRLANRSPLRPGDKLRIAVWREPEFTGEFTVTERGTVVLPKLGAVSVADRDVESVIDEVTAGFARAVVHSSITVVPMRRIQVLGAVRAPGLYHADPTMSLGDVLALAGGASGQGRKDRLMLLRDGRQIAASLTSQTLVAEAPLQSGDQIRVPERNFLSRNPGLIATLISATVGVSIALIRR